MEALKKWRWEEAQSREIPAYCVLTDRTLEIVRGERVRKQKPIPCIPTDSGPSFVLLTIWISGIMLATSGIAPSKATGQGRFFVLLRTMSLEPTGSC